MDPLSSLLKMAASLALVLGIMLLSAYLFKRFFGGRLGLFKSEPLIHVLATSHFGGKREIAVVEVGGVYLVVGITTNQISLLTKLDTLPPATRTGDKKQA